MSACETAFPNKTAWSMHTINIPNDACGTKKENIFIHFVF